ncbi:MAG: sigma-70 family RNA polymerase sigma factor [Planctomycetes bacterium]|nr:sigma-70 family RNA polymerase sigma factor [Planctomycetota bacterium]
MDLSSPSDSELLRRFVVEQDHAAAAALVERWQRPVYDLVLRIVRHEADAADATQAAFLAALRGARGFRGEAAFGTWLYRIAVNEAHRQLRQRPRRTAMEPDVESLPTPSSEDTARHRERLDALEREVAALPEAQRLAVALHYQRGLRYEEVAEVLGIAPGTVASRLAAARERLKARLAAAKVAAAAAWDLEADLRVGAWHEPPASLASRLASAARSVKPALWPTWAPAAATAAAALVVASVGIAFASGAIGPKATDPLGPAASGAGSLLAAQQPGTPATAPAARTGGGREAAEEVSSQKPAAGAAGEIVLRIEGVVRDEASGAPIAEALMQLGVVWPELPEPKIRKGFPTGILAKTDAEGRYKIEAKIRKPTIFQLEAIALLPPGAARKEPSFLVPPPPGVDASLASLFDRRDSSRGADLRVMAVEESTTLREDFFVRAKVTPDGSEFRKARKELIGLLRARFDRESLPYLCGVFQREDGASVKGVSWSLLDERGYTGCPGAQELLDPASGLFLIGPVTAAPWNLQAVMEDGAYAVARNMQPSAGKPVADLVLTLRAGNAPIAGIVVDEEGKPLEDVTISVRPTELSETPFHYPTGSFTTKADGAFRIAHAAFAGATVQLTASTPDADLRSTTLPSVAAGNETLRIVLRRKPAIVGRLVVKGTGAVPSGHYSIDVDPVGARPGIRSNLPVQTFKMHASMDPRTGEFTYRVSSPGTYELKVLKGIGNAVLSRTVEVTDLGINIGAIEIESTEK